MCWSHYTTPPQVFRASLTRGKSSCIWYGVMRPRARPLNIIILFMERWYIGNGWTYKFEGKMFDIRGKNSGVYNVSSEKKKINRPSFSYGSKYRWRYLLITMYSSNIPTYVSVFFCRVYDGVVSVPISTPKE